MLGCVQFAQRRTIDVIVELINLLYEFSLLFIYFFPYLLPKGGLRLWQMIVLQVVPHQLPLVSRRLVCRYNVDLLDWQPRLARTLFKQLVSLAGILEALRLMLAVASTYETYTTSFVFVYFDTSLSHPKSSQFIKLFHFCNEGAHFPYFPVCEKVVQKLNDLIRIFAEIYLWKPKERLTGITLVIFSFQFFVNFRGS